MSINRDVVIGAMVRARVREVDEAGVRVGLRGGAFGAIPREELPFLAGRPLDELPGMTLPAVVTRVDAATGEVELSARRAAVARARRALAGGRSLRGRVVRSGTHGLLLDVAGVRGFVPAAALGEEERSAAAMVGERWRGRVVAVTDHLCILGRLPEPPGAVVTGTVQAIGPEGAWVALAGRGARRALAVRDELGWTPGEEPAVGDAVSGAVLDLTMSGPRISLRALQPSPWPAVALELEAGMPVTAAVRATTADGAIVRLVDQPHAEAHVLAGDLPGAVRAGVWLHAVVRQVDVRAGRLALVAIRTGPGPRPGREARTGERRAPGQGAAGSCS